ncbi:hypothetical protein SGFS_048190 [Streptomyces graminofaciens]|uniref:Uncharacterized protein n=1 Tax=Streptomyces graminofaciens TaxID=68212 RepID=A0ABM7FBS9_9ACTN|nr:hypothetical protein SGFS_048190 [Streptomyces graminofaciens]
MKPKTVLVNTPAAVATRYVAYRLKPPAATATYNRPVPTRKPPSAAKSWARPEQDAPGHGQVRPKRFAAVRSKRFGPSAEA